ncbi:MAG: ATP-binding protein, partial [Muribaculaceae bacterium]|nr:ATP-binding protein [Muribaculaceae bacterium]
GFLFDKEFRYDESHVRIGLYFRSDRNNASEISLDKLSSGEKQIIALMAAAYLSIGKRHAFIMDEPELSLSLIWQRRLLPELVGSGNCSLLLVATHSPFVFDNEMRRFTSGTDEYVKFLKN